MIEFKSLAERGRQFANSLREREPKFSEEPSNQECLLAYVTSLEQELLRNSPYRIGKRWPGRKSVEGYHLVLILRRALAVTRHLPSLKNELPHELRLDMSQLHQIMEDAGVMKIAGKEEIEEELAVEVK